MKEVNSIFHLVFLAAVFSLVTHSIHNASTMQTAFCGEDRCVTTKKRLQERLVFTTRLKSLCGHCMGDVHEHTIFPNHLFARYLFAVSVLAQRK